MATKDEVTHTPPPNTYGPGVDYVKQFGRSTKRILGGRLRSPDQLIGTIRNAEALGWNLYLNANPTFNRPGKKKLAREDVRLWRYITVDLDPGADALEPPDTANWGSKLPDEHLSKAHRIFSGRGYQYWLPVVDATCGKPWEFEYMWAECKGKETKDYYQDAERIMQGYLRAMKNCSDQWAPGWIVDTTCSDLARVVRCPGSVNQKTGRRATVEFVSKNSLDITELMRYNTPIEQPRHPYSTLVTGGEWKLMDVLPHMNITARKFILEGAAYPGRHTACYATCKNLQELGVPRDRAFEWLLIGAGKCHIDGCKPAIPAQLGQVEVEQIVKQVYGR